MPTIPCKKLTKSLCEEIKKCEWVTKNGCRVSKEHAATKPAAGNKPKTFPCKGQKKAHCEELKKCEWLVGKGCRVTHEAKTMPKPKAVKTVPKIAVSKTKKEARKVDTASTSCRKLRKAVCEAKGNCEWVTRNGCKKSVLL